MVRPVPAGHRSRRLRYRTARIRPAPWAGNGIPGCCSRAPSDPLLCCASPAGEYSNNDQRVRQVPAVDTEAVNFSARRYPSRVLPGRRSRLQAVAEENEDILVSVENGVGVVTLNRPKAINSLNDVMVAGLAKALDDWEHDDSVHTVLLTGAGERGLCAGGDVIAIYHSAKVGGAKTRAFWHDEYVLNAHIARYPKPYVAVMDGIVMGGGVGVSAHGSVARRHRHHQDGHARGRHRLHPRRGRHLPAVACAGPPRPARRAHRCPVLRRRRHRHGFRRPLRAARRGSAPSRRPSSPTASTPPWPRTPSSRRPVPFWRNGAGSTSASRARRSPTSSPSCAATTQARPTTRPT